MLRQPAGGLHLLDGGDERRVDGADRHLGEVGPLAPEQVLQVLVALSEVMHELRHCQLPE